MPTDIIPFDAVDWDEVEIAYRIGDQTVEEIGVEHGANISEIENRAAKHGWCNGWEGEAIHPKYILFVDEYLKDWDKEGARNRAGLQGITAKALFSNVKVKKLIQKRLKAAAVRANMSMDDVLALQMKIATMDIRKLYNDKGNLVPIHQLDHDTAYAIGGVDVVEGKSEDGSTVTYNTKKIKLLDKLTALRDIATHLGAYVKKVEVTGKDGAPLMPKAMTDQEAARRVAFILMKATTEGNTDEPQPV